MTGLNTGNLTDAAELKRFMETLLERSPAQATEVAVTEWDSALTRFANNGIHQNVNERNVNVRVRVIKDSKTGVASLNQMGEPSAADLLHRAIRIADLQQPGDVVPLPDPAPGVEVPAWSEATAGSSSTATSPLSSSWPSG